MEIGKQKQPDGCFCGNTLCFQPQIGLFPGHHAGVAAEMPVAGHLGKAGRGQVKAADDGGGTAICLVHDGLINPMFRDRGGAKGVNADGHKAGYYDTNYKTKTATLVKTKKSVKTKTINTITVKGKKYKVTKVKAKAFAKAKKLKKIKPFPGIFYMIMYFSIFLFLLALGNINHINPQLHQNLKLFQHL